MLFAQQPTPTPQQQLEQLQKKYNDFAGLQRYAADNTKLGPTVPGRVVFFGDSITDNWGRKYGSFFPGKPYVNRGISGQTTSQMVLRFAQDVIHLQPAAVVLLAGTNDVAENTGPITDPQIEDNIRAIVTLARANHIRVILGSIPPADRFTWHPGIEPAERIRTLNAWLESYAAAEHLVYLDYYTALATPDGAMKPDLAVDKYVHPNDAGYAIMQPLAEAAIAKSLAQPAP
jgi:lysophospholipase L1-like esterase